jgi:TIGR03009 family protein
MTRMLIPCLVLALVIAGNQASGQTNPNPGGTSRYLPPRGAAPSNQPAPVQRVFGPQPNNAQPVRQVSDQQPVVRQQGSNVPGPGIVPVPAAPVMPQQPAWFPLAPEQQQWVDQILRYWEQESSKVRTFECKFQRWEYDPVFGPKVEAKTFAEGVIKYAQPDKGLYRIEKLSSFAPPASPGEKPQYIEQDKTFGEHWVCDGKQVFAFNAQLKQLVVTALPPDMQGKAIVDGPLPFLFGAKAETIKARYWIRVLPKTGNGKFWLEAVPKGRQDAQNFKMIHFVIDEKTFLPEMLQLFAPNYDERTNTSRTTHVFTEVKTQDSNALQQLLLRGIRAIDIFHREFYEPKLPFGWKRVVEGDLAAAPAAGPQEAKGPPSPTRRPTSPLPR